MAEAAYQSRVVETLPEREQRSTPLAIVTDRKTGKGSLSELMFGVVDTLDALKELEHDWNVLHEKHGQSTQLFQTYTWVRHWCQHFLPEQSSSTTTRLHIITAHRNGQLVLILPLVQTCTHGQCRLEWLGAPVSQYGDVLVERRPDTHATVARALDFLSHTSGGDIVVLRKVRADSVLADILEAWSPTQTAADIAPAVTLPSGMSFTMFETRYSAKARKNRRRHQRRLSEQGDISFEVVTQGPEATRLIRKAFAFKRAWLTSRRLLSVAFSDARMDTFFQTLPNHLETSVASSCRLRVYVLRCGDREVAINVAFLSGTRLLTHIASYDLQFEKFSPGSLLFENAIAHSLDDGIATFDLMSPGDAYKLDWTDEYVDVHDYAFGLTSRGKAYEALYIRRLRPAMIQFATRMPRLVRPLTRLLNL